MAARSHALFIALLILGSSFAGATVHAASLQISPILIEVIPKSNVATYTLRNNSEQELGVQVSAFRWEQESNEDKLQPADNLMVVPAIVVIPPGKEQLVRVALHSERPSRELSYRLHFQELPGQSDTGTVAVQTLLKVDVPLFFSAKNTNNTYTPRLFAGEDPSQVVAELTNTGSRFMRLSQLTLLDSNGQSISELHGPLYVLPGATRRWVLALDTDKKRAKTVKGEKPTFRLDLKSGRTSDQHLLEVH